VLVLRYPRAMGVVEASWTTFHNGLPNGPVIIGTHGTIVVDGAKVLVFRERGNPAPTRIDEGEALPQGEATLGDAVLRHIEHGTALHPTLDVPLNRAAVAILDAGRRAAASGTVQEVAR
jgi:hypothetical protein